MNRKCSKLLLLILLLLLVLSLAPCSQERDLLKEKDLVELQFEIWKAKYESESEAEYEQSYNEIMEENNLNSTAGQAALGEALLKQNHSAVFKSEFQKKVDEYLESRE